MINVRLNLSSRRNFHKNGWRRISYVAKTFIPSWKANRVRKLAICSYFSGIHMTFVIISSFWTKLRYTKTRLGSKNFSSVLGTVFLDCQVIIFVTYLEKDRSITGTLYTSLVNRFKIELQEKTRTSSIFHHVNVLAHSFGIPLNQIRFPPSQHYLVHHMENQWMMTRKKYYPNKDVISILLFERDQQ